MAGVAEAADTGYMDICPIPDETNMTQFEKEKFYVLQVRFLIFSFF